MKTIKLYLIDFAEGRIKVPDFLKYCKKHSEVLDFLTAIAGSEFKTVVVHKKNEENGYLQYIPEELPFDARLFLNEELKNKGGILGKHLNIHGLFSNIVATAFPEENIIIDDTLHNRYSFMLDACPEYIGGEEVDDLLESLLESLPQKLSKTKRIQLYKELVKEAFHVEAGQYPRWIQEAEWPVGEDGVPMRFVSQKRKKGKEYDTMFFTEFLFEDVKTGKQRVIKQFT